MYNKKITMRALVHSFPKIKRIFLKIFKKASTFFLLSKIDKANIKIRNSRFEIFYKKRYYSLSEKINSFNKLKRKAFDYSSVVVGSDQLWLPEGFYTDFYNLMFVDSKINKIDCCGCSACYNVCPTSAIERESNKGYYYDYGKHKN